MKRRPVGQSLRLGSVRERREALVQAALDHLEHLEPLGRVGLGLAVSPIQRPSAMPI